MFQFSYIFSHFSAEQRWLPSKQESLTEGGRISTLDLLALTSLDQHILMLKFFLQNKLPY